MSRTYPRKSGTGIACLFVKPCSEANTVRPDTDALKAFSRIRETGATGLLVADRNHLLAIGLRGTY